MISTSTTDERLSYAAKLLGLLSPRQADAIKDAITLIKAGEDADTTVRRVKALHPGISDDDMGTALQMLLIALGVTKGCDCCPS